MIEYRYFKENDFDKVQKLYKESLAFDMTKEFYNYLYKTDQGYCSTVCEVNNNIIGHNAIIPKTYKVNNEEITIGLSSGGMVDTDYSGVFLKLLKHGIKNFDGKGVIAFPNKNSEPFFSKLLKFNTIQENYFRVTKDEFDRNFNTSFVLNTQISPKELSNRLRHPSKKYTDVTEGNTRIIYKEYGDDIDLLYVSQFSEELILILEALFEKGFKGINMIFNKEEIPLAMGFKKQINNTFVYKWLDKDYSEIEFNCQMIDSDVF